MPPSGVSSVVSSVTAYAVFRTATYIVPSWTPGLQRLDNYFRETAQDKCIALGLRVAGSAVARSVGLDQRGIAGQLGDMMQQIGLADYVSQAIGDRITAQFVAPMGEAVAEATQNWFSNLSENQAVLGGARTLASFTFDVALGVLASDRDNGWPQLDGVLGLDRKLDSWKVSSQHFRGGDTLRKGIKGFVHFLIDLFVLHPNRRRIPQAKAAWTNVKLATGTTGANWLLDRLRSIGIQNNTLSHMVRGGYALGFVHAAMSGGFLLAGGMWAASRLPKEYAEPIQGIAGIGFAMNAASSALGFALSPAGIAGLGVGGAAIAALYVRQNLPEWEARMDDKRRKELDAIFFSTAASAEDEFDPLKNIERLYNVETTEESLLYQDFALVQADRLNKLVKLRSQLAKEEIKAKRDKRSAQAPTRKAAIADFKNKIEELEGAIKANQEIADEILERAPLLKLRLKAMEYSFKQQDLQRLEAARNIFLEGAGNLGEFYKASKEASGDILEAIQRRYASISSAREETAEDLVFLNEQLQNQKALYETSRIKVIELIEKAGTPEQAQKYRIQLAAATATIEQVIRADAYKGPIGNLKKVWHRLRGTFNEEKPALAQAKIYDASIKAFDKISEELVAEQKETIDAQISALLEITNQLSNAEAEYKAAVSAKTAEVIQNLPEINDDTKAIDIYSGLLKLAVAVKDGHVSLGEQESVLNKLKENILQLKTDRPNMLDLLNTAERAALELTYNNLFPLGNNARYNNTEGENGAIEVRATDRTDQLGSVDISTVTSKGEEWLAAQFYQPPQAIINGLDARLINELRTGNAPEIAIPSGLSVNRVFNTLREEYEYLFPLDQYNEDSPPAEKYDEFVKRRLVELTGSAKAATRASQVLHKDAAVQATVGVESKIRTNQEGNHFIPYAEGRFLQLESKQPTYSMHLAPASNGSFYCTLKARWKVIGHANGTGSTDVLHPLDAEKESYYEAYVSVHITSPKSTKDWGEWLGGNWWSWATGNPDPADYEKSSTNYAIEISDRGAVAFINDTLISDLKFDEDTSA